MTLFTRNTRFRKGLRGDGWATLEYYGAKGSASVNDKGAFDAACADLSAAGGGRLLLGPKLYRFDNLLTVPSNVSIHGVPDATYVAWNHATANGLVYTSYNEGTSIEVSDIRFISLIGNTGTCVVNNTGARVQLKRCSWNGFDAVGAPSNNLQGKLASLNSATSELEYIDCRLNVAGVLRGVDIISGSVKITRGSLLMPASYADGLVYAVSSSSVLSLDDVQINGAAHTTGAGYFVYAGNGSNVCLDGCHLLGGGSVGSKRLLGWDAGARVIERRTHIASIPAMERYGSAAALSNYSSLELLGYLAAYPASPYTIPDGVRHVSVAFNGAAPTLIMPAKLFAGQRISVSVFNDASGGNWAGVTVTGLVFGGTNAINNNNGRSFEAVVTDRNGDGTLEWVIVGGWSDMFP